MFFKELSKAFASYGKAHSFIVKHRLWGWIFLPGLLYMFIIAFAGYGVFTGADGLVNELKDLSGLDTVEKKYNYKIVIWLIKALGTILKMLMVFLLLSLYKYIYLIIFSPLFALLSEKVAELKEGKNFPFNFIQLMKDIWRAFLITIRNTFFQLLYMLLLFILSWIPVIGWFTSFLFILLDCYYFGFAMLDYNCERNKLSAKQSFRFIANHKGLAIGNGAGFLLLHLIPFLGWILAPGYATVAATLSLYEEDGQANLK